MQHAGAAVCSPQHEERMDVFGERAIAPDGDEARVSLLPKIITASPRSRARDITSLSRARIEHLTVSAG
jgi:hypothetical protein